MTALILQARLDSSRLPGKSLLPLGGKPLIFRVMEAFGSVSSTFQWSVSKGSSSNRSAPWDAKILACPEDCVSAFAPLAEEAGFELVPGPKDDVLARYCLAIRACGAERVIRATGDNPFVFVDAAAALNLVAQSLNADYAAFSSLPLGAGVESAASEALFRAEREAVLRAEREHVCPYLYGHPELFCLQRTLAPAHWQGAEIRITVDTKEDYERAEALYAKLLPLPPEERNLGENVIAAYRSLFGGKA
jgi:spore coat polysaccharide biosynthesis protein SpsF